MKPDLHTCEQHLRVLASRWDDIIGLLDDGPGWLLGYESEAMLMVLVKNYSHPALSSSELIGYWLDLRDAVNAHSRWELDGVLPDTMDEAEAFLERSGAEISATLDNDVDLALSPLIHGLPVEAMCWPCRRQNAYVKSWRKALSGSLLCAVHTAERSNHPVLGGVK